MELDLAGRLDWRTGPVGRHHLYLWYCSCKRRGFTFSRICNYRSSQWTMDYGQPGLRLPFFFLSSYRPMTLSLLRWPEATTEWPPSSGSPSLLARKFFFQFMLQKIFSHGLCRCLEIAKKWPSMLTCVHIFLTFIVSRQCCLSRRVWVDSACSWLCSSHLLSSTLSSAPCTTTKSMVPRVSTSFPTEVLSAFAILYISPWTRSTVQLFNCCKAKILLILTTFHCSFWHRFLEGLPQPGGRCCSSCLGFCYRTRPRRRIRVRVKNTNMEKMNIAPILTLSPIPYVQRCHVVCIPVPLPPFFLFCFS